MTDRLKGKSIAITGAGRGIGRSLALQFASEGARIVVADYGADGEGGGSGEVQPLDRVAPDLHLERAEAEVAQDEHGPEGREGEQEHE